MQKQHANFETKHICKKWDLILANSILYLFKRFIKYSFED
jgi:hypothetical protein